MAWVVLVARKTVSYEFVGDALDALPLEPEPAGDVRDGRAIAGGLEDHAPGMRLTRRRGHPLPGVAQEPVHLEDGMQCRVGVGVRAATPDKPKSKWHNPKLGYAFVHTVIDDHSRVAYTEVHDDETAVTAVGILHRAVVWFAVRGVTIERVLSDNGGAYRSHLWRDTCEALSITPKRTRPYRPQTNGKVERFHRTMADGWAYARCYTTEQERRDALPKWLHQYNHHRPHTACGNKPPSTRLPVPTGETALVPGLQSESGASSRRSTLSRK